MLVDLLLSYRATKAWDDMIRLVEAMPEPARATVLVREQLGFALNRAGRSEEAEKVLRDVLDEHGAEQRDATACSAASTRIAGRPSARARCCARGDLKQAIDAYRRGFEADWRDAYPGVNAVTLMEILEPGGASSSGSCPWSATRSSAGSTAATPTTGTTRHGSSSRWSPATRGGEGGRARGARRRPRAVGAGEHRQQPVADPRGARRGGETLDWADALERELKAAAGRSMR